MRNHPYRAASTASQAKYYDDPRKMEKP